MVKRGISRRAQLSLEFLMTYGWVIFVVLGLVAAFSFVGVLYPETYVSERCILSPPLFCEDSSLVESTGDAVLIIRNSFHEDININEISLSEELGCYTIIMPPGGELIRSDGTKEFIVDCDFTKGQLIKGEVKIKYAEAGAPIGLVRAIRGEILGKV